MTNTFNWINFVLIVIILIYIIVVTILYFVDRNNTISTGIPLNIIEGTKIGSTDTFTMRGNYVYIAQSNQSQSRNGFILNLNTSSSQAKGNVSYIKNTTSSNITVRGTTAIINVAGLTNTITGGQTGVYLAMDDSKTWMRIS